MTMAISGAVIIGVIVGLLLGLIGGGGAVLIVPSMAHILHIDAHVALADSTGDCRDQRLNWWNAGMASRTHPYPHGVAIWVGRGDDAVSRRTDFTPHTPGISC
jgi:hypothetical protein